MVNKPARFTTADVLRAGRAAKELGPEWYVSIAPAPDSTISIKRQQPPEPVQYDWSPPPPRKGRVL